MYDNPDAAVECYTHDNACLAACWMLRDQIKTPQPIMCQGASAERHTLLCTVVEHCKSTSPTSSQHFRWCVGHSTSKGAGLFLLEQLRLRSTQQVGGGVYVTQGTALSWMQCRGEHTERKRYGAPVTDYHTRPKEDGCTALSVHRQQVHGLVAISHHLRCPRWLNTAVSRPQLTSPRTPSHLPCPA